MNAMHCGPCTVDSMRRGPVVHGAWGPQRDRKRERERERDRERDLLVVFVLALIVSVASVMIMGLIVGIFG